MSLDVLRDRLNLGELLDTLRHGFGGYELVAHGRRASCSGPTHAPS